MNIRQFPALDQFLSGYFHQDFLLEHGNPEGAVDAFLSEASEDSLRAVSNEFLISCALLPTARIALAVIDRYDRNLVIVDAEKDAIREAANELATQVKEDLPRQFRH